METNYVSVGKTVQCGECEPKKYPKCDADCDCVCHDQEKVDFAIKVAEALSPPPTPDWEMEFEEKWGSVLVARVKSLLSQDHQRIKDRIRSMQVIMTPEPYSAGEHGRRIGRNEAIKDILNLLD